MLCLLCAMPLSLVAGGLGASMQTELEFPFYGQTLSAASLDAVKVKSVRDPDVVKAWQDYQKRDVSPAISSLQTLSDELGLNDWFVFQLVREYVDGLLTDASPVDRVLLEHVLLVKMGYERVDMVEGRGQCALRGDIVDAFSPAENGATRIEFWDDEVDSIRAFDPISQRSLEPMEEAAFYPAVEWLLPQERAKDIRALVRNQLNRLPKACCRPICRPCRRMRTTKRRAGRSSKPPGRKSTTPAWPGCSGTPISWKRAFSPPTFPCGRAL